MTQFKLFKAKTFVIMILIFILLIIGFLKQVDFPLRNDHPIRLQLINIAKVAIPLKNLILMRNIDDKIALLKSSGSCVFCNLTQEDLKGNDLNGVDLRYATLSGANLSNTNLTGANLKHTDISGANLSNTNLTGADLRYSNLPEANLSNTNLSGANLRYANLTGANLSRVDMSNEDLRKIDLIEVNMSDTNPTGANLLDANFGELNLSGTALMYADLSGANLNGVDLRNKDLTGTNLSGVDLRNKDLSGANLSGVDLRNKDLTGANLSGVDLRNKDLTGTILTQANLSGANLNGVNLRNKDLSGANLSGVDLRNKDLTGTILKDAVTIKIEIKNTIKSNWSALNEIQNINVSRYDLSGDIHYLATKEGFLFESKNNELSLVLDLNKDAQFPFKNNSFESGLLGIASQNKLVYVSYSSLDINGLSSLVVDEYSMNFTKVRNIIKIGGFQQTHFGGSLLFDNLGKLYLSVGDGENDIKNSQAQNLNSLRGKILRLDVSKLKLEPEIIAYGIRNPWGVTIDSKDRIFILQCGNSNVEAVYLINDLYSSIPSNLGWPVFEGSTRMRNNSLMFNTVLAPIFEYNYRPGCLTAGVYLNDIESFLFADYYGTIRLLKQQKNGEWYLLHEHKQEKSTRGMYEGPNFIWSLGLDKKTKKIFIAPNNLELEIIVDQVNLNQ